MTDSFSKQVEAMIGDNVKLLVAVARSAIGDVINEASTSKFKGGKMPVKTGFLRASGKAAIGQMPSGPNRGDPNIQYPSADTYASEGHINVILAQMKSGDTFYFGWTAEYANVQNVYNGFMDAAIQNWPMYVMKRAEEAKRRKKK